MKKNLFLLFILMLAAPAFGPLNTNRILASEPLFSKGDRVFNLGLGLGTTLYSGAGYKASIPPLSLSLTYCINDEAIENASIGLGGYIGLAGSSFEVMGYGWKYTYVIVGARATLHYPLVDKLDTYGGVLLGYNVVSAKETGTPIMGASPSAGGVAWSVFAGARYYFTDQLGAMLELGYGISYLNLGISYKL